MAIYPERLSFLRVRTVDLSLGLLGLAPGDGQEVLGELRPAGEQPVRVFTH